MLRSAQRAPQWLERTPSTYRRGPWRALGSSPRPGRALGMPVFPIVSEGQGGRRCDQPLVTGMLAPFSSTYDSHVSGAMQYGGNVAACHSRSLCTNGHMAAICHACAGSRCCRHLSRHGLTSWSRDSHYEEKKKNCRWQSKQRKRRLLERGPPRGSAIPGPPIAQTTVILRCDALAQLSCRRLVSGSFDLPPCISPTTNKGQGQEQMRVSSAAPEEKRPCSVRLRTAVAGLPALPLAVVLASVPCRWWPVHGSAVFVSGDKERTAGDDVPAGRERDCLAWLLQATFASWLLSSDESLRACFPPLTRETEPS